jgi:hypothetical protein
MTFGWRNMLAIETDITYRFSIAGVTQRHSTGITGRVRQLFNASWRETREIIAFASDGSYLIRSATLALPLTAAVVGPPAESYAEIPWPTDAIAVYGVRCNVNGTKWYPLKRVPFAAIHDFQYEGTFAGYAPNRGPIAYATRLIPDGVGSTETAGQIMIMPVPTSGNYALWYLQGWADRTADADTIPGMADHIEHAILGTLIKMAQPDSDSQKQVQMWMIERNRIEELVTSRAMKLEAGIPLEARDARFDGFDRDFWRGPL